MDEDYDKTFTDLDYLAGETPKPVCRVMVRMKDEIDRLRAELKELEKDGEDYRSYINILMEQRGG